MWIAHIFHGRTNTGKKVKKGRRETKRESRYLKFKKDFTPKISQKAIMYSFWSLEDCCECFCLRQRCEQTSAECHSAQHGWNSGRVQVGAIGLRERPLCRPPSGENTIKCPQGWPPLSRKCEKKCPLRCPSSADKVIKYPQLCSSSGENAVKDLSSL